MKRSLLIIGILSLLVCPAAVSAQKRKTPVKKKLATVAAPVAATPVSSAEEDEPAPKEIEFKATGPADADGWRVYESTEDSFKLAFPAVPVVTDSTDNAGKKDGNRYYTPDPVTGVRLSLTMTVQALGVPSVDTAFKRKIYQAWAEGVSAEDGRSKTTLVSQKEFAIGDGFGLDIIVDRSAYRFHGRIVCAADKCYQYAVGSGAPDALKPAEITDLDKWTKKFFDSFQLTKSNQ